MIVIDVSLWFDLFNRRNELRVKLAEAFFNEVEVFTIYEPILFKIEFVGLLIRYNPRDIVRKMVEEIVAKIRLCTGLDDEAYKVALATGCRAADAYYIACASKTDSILFSNDKSQVINANKYGIEAFYVLEEKEKAFSKIEKLKESYR
ncbi:MAG: type II toxin-antitoxin system VapC family toxin [archaeon GB-1867-035]|nr:type II toxin-antitoxin system VapC family toxin [Candidatus Culexmicrobium profundum]